MAAKCAEKLIQQVQESVSGEGVWSLHSSFYVSNNNNNNNNNINNNNTKIYNARISMNQRRSKIKILVT